MKKTDTFFTSKLLPLLTLMLLMSATSFAQTIQIKLADSGFIFHDPPFKSCHASTIVQLEGKKLMAAWFGGENEGHPQVSIWTSIKNENGWTDPVKTVDGIQSDGTSFACWNPVLFKARNGILYLHYKVGPNPREWWALHKYSKDDGKSWSEPIPLPSGFLGPIKDKPVQLANGEILYPSSVESKDEKHWTIHMEISDENLNHWKKIKIDCDTFQVIQPTLLVYPGNKLQLLARSKENVIVQSWSSGGGHTWSKITKTNLPNPNSGIDAATLNHKIQLLVYNPLTSGKDWWNGRSVLKLAESTDGERWTDIYTFENKEKGEFSYPAIITDGRGNVYVTYTFDRKNIKFVHLVVE